MDQATSQAKPSLVELDLIDFGGSRAVHDACLACPVNVPEKPGEFQLAGCAGSFFVESDPNKFARPLRSVIRELGWKERLQDYFPYTRNPIFGFWMKSPWEKERREMALELFRRMTKYRERSDDNWKHFVAGLERACEEDRPFHVRVPRPGSCSDDSEFFTWKGEPLEWVVSSHCPRCRMVFWHDGDPLAAGERIEELMAERHRCGMCGQFYVPKRTSGRMTLQPGFRNDLKLLTEEKLEAFQRSYLRSRGVTPVLVEESIRKYREEAKS